jgi:methionine synthase II (cobalamin-independent)
MAVSLPAGSATLIGSLPHDDPDEAAAFALAGRLGVPTAPQLPHRGEGMLAQAADGIRGVTPRADGNLAVDSEQFDADADIRVAFGTDRWAGLLSFLSRVEGRTKPVKVQLTGPVTLALALMDVGVAPDAAFRVSGRAVEARARALTTLFAARSPATPLVAFLDEPGLTAWGHPRLRVDADPLIELLAKALAALAPAFAGVHCCGVTDWSLPVAAGAAVLSLPLEAARHDDGRILPRFLEEGGWLAWGVVPTTGPVGDDPEALWRRLVHSWLALAEDGCDPQLLRSQCLITPVCGMAGHGVSQARRVMRLTAAVARRVASEA